MGGCHPQGYKVGYKTKALTCEIPPATQAKGLREGEMGEKYLWSNTVAALYKLDNHNNFVMNCEFEIYFFRFNNLLYSVHTCMS